MQRSAMAWVLVAVACGPTSGSDDGDSSGTGGSSQGGDSSSDEGQSDTGGIDSSGTVGGGSETAAPGDTGESTGETGTPSTTSAETSGGSTGAVQCDDGSSYRAAMFFGGLDRITIYRRDDALGTCVWMTLAAPLDQSEYEVETTVPWALEQVWRNEDPASCDTADPGAAGQTSVPDAWGTIAVQTEPAGACTADVDVELQLLENPDPGVVVELCAEAIAIEGC